MLKVLALLFCFSFAFNVFCAETADNSAGTDFQSSVQSSDNQTDESKITINSTSFDESSVPIGTGSSAADSIWVFLRMVLVLALIIALIYLCFRLYRKNSNAPEDNDPFLRRVASISIGPGKSVQIVTLLEQAYIIGVCENSVNLIDKVDDRELVNALNVYADTHSTTSKPKNFAEVLDIFMGKKNLQTSADKSSEKKEKKSSGLYDGSTQQVLDMLKKQSHRLNDQE